ncbi:MAG: epoxyqueuosine reductase QueH [bacterium]
MTRKHKILAHACCAACASSVFAELKKENFDVTAYFYNPEIHGEAEYLRRLNDLEKYCTENAIPLIVPEYNIQEFIEPILPYQTASSIKYINDKDRYHRKRCEICTTLLIENTIQYAKKHKFKYFTTTMLCSPYKDHNKIWDIADSLASDKDMNYYYKDFRKGYWNGRNYARNHNMNIPAYCGCNESLEEGRLE